ncbi:MAG TPA: SAM-dependent chlorinase/fluorinase [Actinomycetota bacterium]|nr:SAM-dependent chlorinase/fluorinase [Actinomycetota bacterium]
MGVRPILFLSDYGTEDEFVGICHAVMARIAPAVRILDLSHGIPPGDVLRGGEVLREAVRHAPEAAVYLAVVDPGVGTDRRGLALEAGSSFLVGPDNGLLVPAAEALGGTGAAVALEEPGASPTFHGRDVFAPAAASLAAGGMLEELGAVIDPSTLVPSPRLELVVDDSRVGCRVAAVDRYGNVQLDATPESISSFGDAFHVRWRGGEMSTSVVRTFADLPDGAPGLLVDSWGRLAIAVKGSSAATMLGLAPGDAVEIGPGSDR